MGLHGYFEHPRFRLDALQPILDGWYPAQVFHDMLFPDGPYWHHLDLVGHENRQPHPKDPLTLKDPLGVVPNGTVSEVREEFFRRIEPVVNLQVRLGFAPVPFGATDCVMVGMHGQGSATASMLSFDTSFVSL